MTDEELAEFILKNCDNPLHTFNDEMCDRCPVDDNPAAHCHEELCKEAIVRWLKENVQNE